MNRTIRTSALAAAAVILASTLAGCLGAAPPTGTAAPSTPSSEPSPTPTATAGGEPVIAAIVVRPEHLDLQDASGAVVQTLSYDLPAGEVVSVLSVVFGGEPVVEEYAGRCCESRPSTMYRWDQFTVRDDHMGQFADDDQSVWIPDDGPDYVDMNLLVQVAGPEVRGVAITTAPGFEVGDDLAELAAGLGQSYADGSFVEIAVETGPELGPPEIEGMVNAHSVVVQAPGSESEVQISAPINIGVGRV